MVTIWWRNLEKTGSLSLLPRTRSSIPYSICETYVERWRWLNSVRIGCNIYIYIYIYILIFWYIDSDYNHLVQPSFCIELAEESVPSVKGLWIYECSKWSSTIQSTSTHYQLHIRLTAEKVKFPITDFFSKCDQIGRKLRIWSHYWRNP